MTRVYVRSFDWELARQRVLDGETKADVARDYGVTKSAITYACDPEKYRRSHEQSKSWYQGGVCKDCGAPCTRRHPGQTSRCKECADLLRATSVRKDTLRCKNCRKWKPDEDFPGYRNNPTRRGRHDNCRPCNTIVRRENREKAKISCAGGCGRQVDPPSAQKNKDRPAKCQSCAGRAVYKEKREALQTR